MANNLLSVGLNFRIYVAPQVGRLIGATETNEVNISSIFSSATTDRIFYTTSTGAIQSYSPTNSFSSLRFLTPGHGYAVLAKTAFEFDGFYSRFDAAIDSQILAAIRNAIDGGSSNPPIETFRLLTTSGGYWRTTSGGYWLTA